MNFRYAKKIIILYLFLSNKNLLTMNNLDKNIKFNFEKLKNPNQIIAPKSHHSFIKFLKEDSYTKEKFYFYIKVLLLLGMLNSLRVIKITSVNGYISLINLSFFYSILENIKILHDSYLETKISNIAEYYENSIIIMNEILNDTNKIDLINNINKHYEYIKNKTIKIIELKKQTEKIDYFFNYYFFFLI